jgi:hypothetical protein
MSCLAKLLYIQAAFLAYSPYFENNKMRLMISPAVSVCTSVYPLFFNFLCGPCLIKGKWTITSSQNFLLYLVSGLGARSGPVVADALWREEG